MAKFRAERITTIARYDLPAPLARDIGRFLVTWAHFEHYAQTLVWQALQMDAPTGRIAVREPRVTDRVDMLIELGELQNIGMDYVLLLDIRKRANTLAAYRHILAHSLWTYDKAQGEWCALITRGAWAETQGEFIGERPTGSKAVQPEARPVRPEELREWTAQTIKLIEDIKLVGDKDQPRPKPSQQKRS